MTTTSPVAGVDAQGNIAGTTNQLPWAPIPAQYKTELTNMAKAGSLGGVPPQLLSWIMEAESGPSYQGGYVNGSGFGGWFGLAATKYPTGTMTTATLHDASIQSFDMQSMVTAGEFASLLSAHNGDAVAAENAYQGSAGNGQTIFTTYLKAAGTNVLNTQLTPAQTAVGDIGTATGTTTTGTTSWLTELGHVLGDLASVSWWERVGMGALGLALFGIGLSGFISTTKPGQSAKGNAAGPAVGAAAARVMA